MELVYLWVEDYKNIKKQGFNFSPRFECGYDGFNLDININDKANFFDTDGKINIMAIVGENGSGKSNVLESLLCIIYENGVPWDNYKLTAIFYDEQNKKYHQKSINYSIFHVNNIEISEGSTPDIEIFSFHYNYSLDYIKNEENNINFDKFYHKTDNYKTPILLQPNKANHSINIKTMDYLANQDILNFIIHKKISFSNINSFFEATQCKLDFHYSYIYGTEDSEKDNSLFLYMKNLSLNKGLLIFDDIPPYGLEDFSSKLEYITRDGLILLTKFYIIKKIIKNKKIILHPRLKEYIEEANYAEALDIINNTMFDRLFEYSYSSVTQGFHAYQIYKIRQSFSFIEFLNSQEENYKISDNKINIIEHKNLLLNLAPWISIEFFNAQDISFYDLSYGQRFLIKFLYSLLNQINNLSVHFEYKNIVLMLDEVEMGLHPQWQKEFIALILNVLKKSTNRFDFQIIITSHSPFILSDLPKENVIFLQAGKQVDVDINPFGANIHSLLSHGFFMKDGLMGEFAKGKINDVINFLNEKQSTIQSKEEAKNIIEIIGEPFLKEKLFNMYNNKFQISKEERIQQLENELEKLKND